MAHCLAERELGLAQSFQAIPAIPERVFTKYPRKETIRTFHPCVQRLHTTHQTSCKVTIAAQAHGVTDEEICRKSTSSSAKHFDLQNPIWFKNHPSSLFTTTNFQSFHVLERSSKGKAGKNLRFQGCKAEPNEFDPEEENPALCNGRKKCSCLWNQKTAVLRDWA